jgi:hypothetical protein
MRRLLTLLYLAAFVILLDQAADLVASVWPLRFGLAAWRVGAFGIGISRLEFFALADAMILIAAIQLGHRRVFLPLAIVHLVLGLCLMVGLGLFTLDVLEIRRVFQPERKSELNLAAVRSAVLGGVAAIGSWVVALRAWRYYRLRSRGAQSSDRFLLGQERRGEDR